MKNNKIKQLLWLVAYTGIWIVPMIMFVGIEIHKWFFPYKIIKVEEYMVLFVCGALLALCMWATNYTRIKNGKPKDKVRILSTIINPTPDPYDQNDGKEQFKYPDVKEELLFETPFDCFFSFGFVKQNGRKCYVGIPFDNSAPKAKHILINGV